MKRNAREFIRSTTTLLDHILATLTQEEQHGLLDAPARHRGIHHKADRESVAEVISRLSLGWGEVLA